MHCSPRQTPSTGTPRSPKCADRRRSRGRRPRAGPGPGEISTASGSSGVHLVERDRVVAVHDRLRAQLPQVLHEVVDERVVVVDHEHPRHGATSRLPECRRGISGLAGRASVEIKRSRVHAAAARRRRRAQLWVPVVMIAVLMAAGADRDRRATT